MNPLKGWQVTTMYEPARIALESENIALVGGCTGSGKSYIAAHLIAASPHAPPKVLYVAPKITRTSLERLLPRGTNICNLEKLRTGNTPFVIKHGPSYVWDPSVQLIIFDEAHQLRGGDRPTQNAKLLLATKQLVKRNNTIHKVNIPSVLMSATLAESPLHFRFIGLRLGLFTQQNSTTWLRQHGCFVRTIQTRAGSRTFLEFPKPPCNKPHLEKLIRLLYPRFGGFITQDDIPSFPEAELHAELFDIDPRSVKEIQSKYDEIDHLKSNTFDALSLRLRARQLAELSKVEVFATLAENAVNEGSSVVVFVNFTETRTALASMLEKKNHRISQVYGGQNDRAEQLQAFMDERALIAIVMIQAGGTGLDELSDAHRPNARPRVSFISPNDSATLFLQACGRLVRMNTKNKVFQTVVLAAGTMEEKVKKNLDAKLGNLATLTDADLLGE